MLKEKKGSDIINKSEDNSIVLFLLFLLAIAFVFVCNDNKSMSSNNVGDSKTEVLETIATTNKITSISNINTKTSNTSKSTTTKTTTETTTTTKADKDDCNKPTIEDEEIKEEYTYEEPVTETKTEVTDVVETENSEEEESVNVANDETYCGSFEATWYEGGTGAYGYSGRDLVSGYSVASNYFAQGTILRVVGSGLDGTYRVDDKGSMSNNVIDFYYQHGNVPSNFRYHGRVNIEVYVVE